jgi:HCOMODA/2-hydroxy-3-carboxy-muconic semialdehyde decarboxylase
MSHCPCCLPDPTRRRLLFASMSAAAGLGLSGGAAMAEPASAGAADPNHLDDLVAANHILYDQGVVDGFGHVSVRHDKDPNRYLLARSMAPGLVTLNDIIEYDLDNVPIDANGRASYLERFIHGEIYKRRPDVMSIVHSHSPAIIPFADTGVRLRPMNHTAGFLGAGVPLFEIRSAAGPASDMLIRNAYLGDALAARLGSHPVVLMRGHGSVAVGQSIRHVVFRAIYTEVNARMQAEALKLGTPRYLNNAEAAAATKTNDALVDRPWSLWKQRAMGVKS